GPGHPVDHLADSVQQAADIDNGNIWPGLLELARGIRLGRLAKAGDELVGQITACRRRQQNEEIDAESLPFDIADAGNTGFNALPARCESQRVSHFDAAAPCPAARQGNLVVIVAGSME